MLLDNVAEPGIATSSSEPPKQPFRRDRENPDARTEPTCRIRRVPSITALILWLRFPHLMNRTAVQLVAWHELNPHAPSSIRGQVPTELFQRDFVVVNFNDKLSVLAVLDQTAQHTPSGSPFVDSGMIFDLR